MLRRCELDISWLEDDRLEDMENLPLPGALAAQVEEGCRSSGTVVWRDSGGFEAGSVQEASRRSDMAELNMTRRGPDAQSHDIHATRLDTSAARRSGRQAL